MNIDHPFLTNKYTKWYYTIISTARKRHTNNCYVEYHHIIPECLFINRIRKGPIGSWLGNPNDKNNLVYLTAKEHFICHLLLTKMSDGIQQHKMIKAAFKMCFSDNNQKRYTKITSRIYEYLRTQYSIVQCIARKGKPGRKHSDETKKKLSDINKGKKIGPPSEETRNKLSAALTGRKRPPFSEKWRAKLSITSANRIPVNIGKKCWNNGKNNKFSINCPGDEWLPGQIKIKTISKGSTGMHWFNNGLKNKMSYESPGQEWVKGKLVNLL